MSADPSVEPLSATTAVYPAGSDERTDGRAAASSRHGRTTTGTSGPQRGGGELAHPGAEVDGRREPELCGCAVGTGHHMADVAEPVLPGDQRGCAVRCRRQDPRDLG